MDRYNGRGSGDVALMYNDCSGTDRQRAQQKAAQGLAFFRAGSHGIDTPFIQDTTADKPGKAPSKALGSAFHYALDAGRFCYGIALQPHCSQRILLMAGSPLEPGPRLASPVPWSREANVCHWTGLVRLVGQSFPFSINDSHSNREMVFVVWEIHGAGAHFNSTGLQFHGGSLSGQRVLDLLAETVRIGLDFDQFFTGEVPHLAECGDAVVVAVIAGPFQADLQVGGRETWSGINSPLRSR